MSIIPQILAHAHIDHDQVEGYDLMGVCCHSGGLGGGHYVAHVKSIEDGAWYQHNDSSVSESRSMGHESSAYLLFYKRRHLINDKAGSVQP